MSLATNEGIISIEASITISIRNKSSISNHMVSSAINDKFD